MEEDSVPPAMQHSMTMLETATESEYCSSESTVSQERVGIERERRVSLIQYMVKLLVKQRKQAAEIERLHLSLAELKRDCECMRTQLQRQSALVHEQLSTIPPPLPSLPGQECENVCHLAQNSSTSLSGLKNPADDEESEEFIPEKSISAARLRHHMRKSAVSSGTSVCEQLSTNPLPLPSLRGQECETVCHLAKISSTSPSASSEPGDGKGPGENTPENEESVEHIRHRLRDETTGRLRHCEEEATVSSDTPAPHSSLESLCSRTVDTSCTTLNEWSSQSDIVARQKDQVHMENSAKNHKKHSTVQPPEDNISTTARLKCHRRKAKVSSCTSTPPDSPQSRSTQIDGTSCNPLLVTTGNIQTPVDPYKLTQDWLFTPLDERDVMTEMAIQEEILKHSDMEREARKIGDKEKANVEFELKRKARAQLFEHFQNRQKQNRKFQEKWKEQMELLKEEGKYQKMVVKNKADRQDIKCHEEEEKPIKQRKRKDEENQQSQQKQRRRKSQRQKMAAREAFLVGGQTNTPWGQDRETWGDRPMRQRNFISRCAARTADVVVFVALGGICKIIQTLCRLMCSCVPACAAACVKCAVEADLTPRRVTGLFC